MIVRSSISSSSKQQQSIVYNHNNKTRRFSVLLVIYIHTYAHTVSLWVIQLSTQKTFLFLMLSMEKIHFDGISVIFWLIRLIWSKIGTNWNNLKMRFGLRGKEYLFLWPRKLASINTEQWPETESTTPNRKGTKKIPSTWTKTQIVMVCALCVNAL